MLFVDVGHFLARLLVIILGNERLSGAFPANTTVANDSHWLLNTSTTVFQIPGRHRQLEQMHLALTKRTTKGCGMNAATCDVTTETRSSHTRQHTSVSI